MVAPRAMPHYGGVETHIQELAKELIKQGCEVDVATQDFIEAQTNQIHDGVTYINFPLRLKTFYGISKRLVEYVVNHHREYDVVHLQAIHKPLSIYVAYKLRKTNARLVFTPHYHGGGHTAFANIAHIIYRKIIKKTMHRINHVIAVSDSEKELLLRDFPKANVTVIPNGINMPPKAEPFPKTKPVILTISRLEAYKRIDTIIKEMPLSHQLVVIGSGNDKERLENIAKEYEKDVVFTGYVDDAELNRWWSTADIYVSLSEKEAYGLTVGEALSLGMPTIVSDIPAYRYIHKLSSYSSNLCFYMGKTQLNAIIDTMYADISREKAVLIFTWKQAAEMTTAIYKEER